MRVRAILRQGAMGTLAMLVPLFTAHQAAAQACQADVDCGSGYRCTSSVGVVCSSGCTGPWADAAVAYPPTASGTEAGATRDAGLAEPRSLADAGLALPTDGKEECGEPTCTPYEYRYCTQAPCNTNADCPADMVCYAQTWQECSGAACKPGGDCESDAGYTCTDHTQSTCVERYNVPCATDLACGEGFTCNKATYVTCSGAGSVTPKADGGYEVIDAGTSCSSETPDSGYCSLLELPCEANADCPIGLSCQASYSYPPCVALPSGTSTADASTLPDKSADGGFTFFNCPPPVAITVCRPERWGSAGSAPGSSSGTGGNYADAGSATLADAGKATPPQGGGGSATSGSGSAGGSNASDDSDDEAEEGRGHHKRPHHGHGLLRGLFGAGGCSLAARPAEGNLAWLVVTSALLAWRSRRRGQA